MECPPADLRHIGWAQDDRSRLDRRAPLSPASAERSRASDRRGVLVRRRFHSLCRAGVATRYAAHPALPAHARRDPGDPTGATLGGSAGAGVESASMIKLTRGWIIFP